jgi:hypothetical protein
MSAPRTTPGSGVHVDDARPTLLGLVLIAPAVIALLLAVVFLQTSRLFEPVLVAALVVLAAVIVVQFLRGPTITRR